MKNNWRCCSNHKLLNFENTWLSKEWTQRLIDPKLRRIAQNSEHLDKYERCACSLSYVKSHFPQLMMVFFFPSFCLIFNFFPFFIR